MKKIKCSHCEVKFRSDISIHTMRYINDKPYCKACRSDFCRDLIDNEFITRKAVQLGMSYPEGPSKEERPYLGTGVVELLSNCRCKKCKEE